MCWKCNPALPNIVTKGKNKHPKNKHMVYQIKSSQWHILEKIPKIKNKKPKAYLLTVLKNVLKKTVFENSF